MIGIYIIGTVAYAVFGVETSEERVVSLANMRGSWGYGAVVGAQCE
jgi:hypothetical protein